MRTITEFVFPLFLVIVPLVCVAMLIRLHNMHTYFQACVMKPWEIAIDKEEWELSDIYQQHAHDYVDNMNKLLLQPWRKLPK